MSERMRFITRLMNGERMSDLCREFGISRKTGYKLRRRYEEVGPRGLYDRSRKPLRSPQRTPQRIAERVVELRRRYPTWGPKKLRARLQSVEPEIRWPAASTIGVLLKDAGLVDGRQRRRRAWPTPPSERVASKGPNDLWSIDFKGQFRMGNGQLCYPLTVSDHHSRYLLGCEALTNVKAAPAAAALEDVFRHYGLPQRIRSDNGSPFASTGLAGLTRFSAWLLRLGIGLERIEPGHPEQNGRHERIHLTMKQDAIRPPKHTLLQQQERLDAFRKTYNEVRPHEALNMDPPITAYTPSTRSLPSQLEHPDYPLHDQTRFVTKSGSIRFDQRDVYLSRALTGQRVGLRQLESCTWLVSFMDFDLAYIDIENQTLVATTKGAT